ncbi:hypothetical protein [Deinococcus radiotolerans]|uniref:Tetratricopeptide repeat protein n=1 Tax=Deinococcus radiotolerans TaxID=1309407 RepID=A0ABQ2FMV0_9DEIO|nr:hypothetical protein [Deinococcus radiotolerans]GGL09802.1 hypothetical protein GCM10010844_30630 [Deinococcus radiotolerans]
MRSDYLSAARALQLGRESAVEGDQGRALRLYREALELLSVLPPERTRDVLLAHTHLAFFQTLELLGGPDGQRHLQLGVSYARSTRDPLARAIAEECLSGLDVVM